MINVFKNRTRLCALTTSVFFFLQGVGASSSSWFSSVASYVPSMPSFGFPLVSDIASSLPLVGDMASYYSSGDSPYYAASTQLNPTTELVSRDDGDRGRGVEGEASAINYGKSVCDYIVSGASGLVYSHVFNPQQHDTGVPGAETLDTSGYSGTQSPERVTRSTRGNLRPAFSDAQYPGVSSDVMASRAGVALPDGKVEQLLNGVKYVPASIKTPALAQRLFESMNGRLIYSSISCGQGTRGANTRGAIKQSLNTIRQSVIVPNDRLTAVYVHGVDEIQNQNSSSLKGSSNQDPEILTLDNVSILSPIEILGFSDTTIEMQDVMRLVFMDLKDDQKVQNSSIGVWVRGADKGMSAAVKLKNSNVVGFFIGLRAEDAGMINMNGGIISDAYVGAFSEGGGGIYLDHVNINARKIGLLNFDASFMYMNGGEMTVSEGGVGVMSVGGVGTFLENVSIKIVKKEQLNGEGSDSHDKSVGLLADRGFVSFSGVQLEGSDVVVLQVNDGLKGSFPLLRSSFEEVDDLDDDMSQDQSRIIKTRSDAANSGLASIKQQNDGNLDGVSSVDSVSMEALSTMMDLHCSNETSEISEVCLENRNMGAVIKKMSALNSRLSFTIVDIENSTFKAEGNSYGIYFDQDARDIYDIDKNDIMHAALLKKSTLRVPRGIAIYGENLNGHVIVRDESTLSGGLLLKAEKGAKLSVFVDDSLIAGAARVEEGSRADFVLSGGSEWRVTKSLYNGQENSDPKCMDSCISSMKLSKSSIRFFTSSENTESEDIKGGTNSNKYRTLRIGNGTGVVYSADGNSNIYFNANLIPRDTNSADTNSAQVSDRLLIHGDVSGKTKVHVNPISDRVSSESALSKSDKSQQMPYSVSLIQVSGDAKEDSFTLQGNYITLDGLPYQYVLRAYSDSSSNMQSFDNTLVAKSGKVWDFRLENQYIVSKSVKIDEEVILSRSEDSVVVTPSRGDSFLRSDEGDGLFDEEEDDSYEESSYEEDYEEDYEEYDESFDDESFDEEGETIELFLPEDVTSSTTSNGSRERVLYSTLTRSDTDDIYSDNSYDTDSYDTDSVLTVEGASDLELYGDKFRERDESVTLPVLTTVAPTLVDSVARSDESTIALEVLPIISYASTINNEGSRKSSPSSVARSGRVDNGSVPPSPLSVARSGSINNSSVSPSKEVTVSVENKPSIKPNSSRKSQVSSSSPVARVGIVGNGTGAEVVASQCNNTESNGTKASTSYLCNDGVEHTIKNLTLKVSDQNQHSLRVENQNTIIKLEQANISGSHSSDKDSNIDVTKLRAVSAILADKNAEVVLNKKSTVQSSLIGLEAQRGGKVKMDDGAVNVHYVGALVGSGSSVELSNTNINVTGDLAVAGLASNAGEIVMKSGTITLENGAAVRSESGGDVKLDKVNITVKKEQNKQDSTERFGRAAFLLRDNASVDFTNGNVITDANALWVRGAHNTVEAGASRRKRSSEVRSSMNRANIEFSNIKVEGDKSYGIYFDGTERKGVEKKNQNKNLEKNVVESSVQRSGKKRVVKRNAVSSQEKTPIGITGEVSLKKTDFEVLKSVAIYGNNSGGRVSLENKTTLSGDLLLKAENNSNILVSVDHSVIAGGARVDKSSYAQLDLTNGSGWFLKRSVHENLRASDSGCIDSCVSSVNLVNSRIEFMPLESAESEYQTLRIGDGKGVVYKAQGDVSIHLNARLNPNDPSDNQVTDRLVIHGDVEGKTTVHVRGVSGNVGEEKNTPHSVSVIQVYGKAARDSFQLNGDYVALRNSPYKYTLRAYAPEVTSKQEHAQQKFMKDGGEFWNFRLENQYVKSSNPMVEFGFPKQVVRSVVPQVPTYLLLPNSVFHTGLMDISNQNKQLELLRATSNGMVEVRENPALYLRGYSGSYRYASDLSALEYGYKGDLSYNGVEAGVLLQTIENADSAISFGAMGSYGKLSLEPVDVEKSQKSAFDKWTVTAYGTMQHNVGFYVDGLLSYGLFKGDVLTLARGKTATLKGNPFSASLTGGKTFATGYKGFVVDPQVQVVYQHLQFDKAHDVDNFDIEMGKLDQWVARVGGRLIKASTGSEGMNAVSFYGKLHLAHGFGSKKSVHFKDAFQLGAFGSSLETGLGFNAKLSTRFSLHGDVMYQHKLNKAGFSGASFSGGLRYQF
ncbi:autotransporter outer membrane beta-barrel domain-containing protein [Bartonella harrusi]|uniref:Autotransporter outer membrane beta-barrel domain-containing protein n=1 Tax=Bartonella harrusi TaxID=2961895 RepID=A0ABY5ERK6_9HYPH|nr:autotransporter outer membrane beta-barrel domain-containing protein [Bartonella harrusi]UTO28036.1 autotransporter outer membrane beta-barrel domain-containing protein [Bartonella harrusi]